MILVSLTAAIGRRTGLGFLWRLTALALAALALALAWVVRPRGACGADAFLAAMLTTVAMLLAGAALAGRTAPVTTFRASSRTPCRAPC